MRELTLAPAQLVHPQEMPNGAVTWSPGAGLDDLSDRIRNGDPAQGWEGDVRLTLAFYLGRWELWRLERDNAYRLVCQSRPGLDNPYGIIRFLVDHDQRRGFNLHETVMAHNRKVRDAADVPSDKLQAATDKVAWAIRKDIG